MPTYIIEARLQVEAESIEHAESLADALDRVPFNLDGIAPVVYIDNVRPITED
jgi:hypothetical protein